MSKTKIRPKSRVKCQKSELALDFHFKNWVTCQKSENALDGQAKVRFKYQKPEFALISLVNVREKCQRILFYSFIDCQKIVKKLNSP